jgi:RHH-type proline utilization regulon transcriptional repressor/proline dehydrogenase/delta 1-pyrroline-5-carboxylate dehydrogenase
MPPDAVDATRDLARSLVTKVRAERSGSSGIDALMREFSLSSQEGIALMCLAEALLRIPDRATADRLIRDKIGKGDWKAHVGNSPSLFVNAAAWGLLVTGKLVSTTSEKGLSAALTRLIGRGGEPVIRMAVDLAMRLLGKQFVTGETIEEALGNSVEREARGYLFSYDMLGEAAVTAADVQRYHGLYETAMRAIGAANRGRGIYAGNGISVKLSALHPRYVRAQHDRVMQELLPRLKSLLLVARHEDVAVSIDAEESERLEVSLDLLEPLAFDPDLAGWDGIGFVVQSYQKRCPAVVDYLIDLARRSNRRLMVRLVKGAYWDAEIKRAQVDGQAGYPVFTRKVYSDACFLACAKKLLSAPAAIYPQFATHNAYSLAAVYHLAGDADYEFQCLHGMGETLYDQVVGRNNLDRRCRIYAPVGTHETLLCYLVRRLLENGANSSFVNRLVDPAVTVDDLIADQVAEAVKLGGVPHERIPLPRDLYGAARRNSRSIDLSSDEALAALQIDLAQTQHAAWRAWPMLGDAERRAGASTGVLNPADHDDLVGTVVEASAADVVAAAGLAEAAAPRWAATPPAERALCLERTADLLEERMATLMGLAIREAGKSVPNAVGEVREAVDFCRYYASQIRDAFRNDTHRPLGPVASISPWNFPLAIFVGQISAALAAGNPVLAKPAEQTPLIAAEAVRLFHAAGVPRDVLQLLPGAGDVGSALVGDARVKAVMFTGSTEVALLINRALAKRGDIALIAETGGQNAMIVDSSALPEQVAADVISSAFDSAGQRCSALRVLYLQDDIADRTITMLKGAMDELTVGDPAKLATDVGPVIDEEARRNLQAHIDSMSQRARWRHQAKVADGARGTMLAPTMFEIGAIGELSREVFGPILHVVRYRVSELPRVMQEINSTGYGLTHGVHSRIDEMVDEDVRGIIAGNIYVNRNIIGAVVGVQPFGGHGKSGTGPKAGGPLYLYRLVRTDLSPHLNGQAVAMTLGALDALQSALAQLVDLTPDQRTLLLARIRDYRAQSLVCMELPLPGPTGERNTLRFLPRGTVGCHARALQQLLEQLAAAWATGNCALVPDTDVGRRLVRVIDHPDIAFARDLVSADLDALLFAGDDSEADDIRIRLAAREGALVPFVRERESGGYDLHRLVVEQTVSINTTAAGGNASLMSLSE